jgi:hypothetical protein
MRKGVVHLRFTFVCSCSGVVAASGCVQTVLIRQNRKENAPPLQSFDAQVLSKDTENSASPANFDRAPMCN